MASESTPVLRQVDFSGGPNYADSAMSLRDNELKETVNCLDDGGLRVIPGASAIVATTFPGSSVNITSVFSYAKANGNKFFIATSKGGRMERESSGSWVNIATGLSTVANTFWHYATFNDTLIAVNGQNNPKKWTGSGALVDVGGTPPVFKYIQAHGDYLLGAGHTSNPGQIRYSATSDLNVWPIGNVLNPGIDDGEIITGLIRLGSVVIILKDRSVWQLSGLVPSDFRLDKTVSEVGCSAPQSIVLTDIGIFFWSELGPTLFNGFRSIPLGRKLRTILENDVDWLKDQTISAAYYPFKRHLLVSFTRIGQTVPDRALLADLRRADELRNLTWWPINFGFTASGSSEDSTGRNRAYLGTSDGYVLAWDVARKWRTTTIIGRARSRLFDLGRPERVKGVRYVDVWAGSTTGNLITRYAANGSTTMTAHGSSPTSLLTSGKDLTFTRFKGDGVGNFIPGRVIQLEIENDNSNGFTLHEWAIHPEDFGKRGDTT